MREPASHGTPETHRRVAHDQSQGRCVADRDAQSATQSPVALEYRWRPTDDRVAKTEGLCDQHRVGAGNRRIGRVSVGRVVENQEGRCVVEKNVLSG
jgi:hypothetical protein